MRPASRVVLALVVASGLASCYRKDNTYPKVRAGRLGLVGSWMAATLIVQARLTGIEYIGKTEDVELPLPYQQGLRTVFWCKGDLAIEKAIRGVASTRVGRFVWGEIRPGCQTPVEKQATSGGVQIWFLRPEDGLLRPVVDAGGVFFYTFRSWGRPSLSFESERDVAELFLDPDVSGPGTFGEPARLACSVLGEADCVEQICNGLTSMGEASRATALGFVRTEFSRGCSKVPKNPVGP